MRAASILAAVMTAAACLGPDASAQIRGSEHAIMEQTIDGTDFRVEYFRPRMRGREKVFGDGGIVWEHVWTPGANWATKFSFQKPVEFAGVSIPAGTWSVWFQTDEHFVPTEFFFEPDTMIFHLAGPQRADDQIRIPVASVDEASYREVMSWEFEDVRNNGGTLAMRWGNTRIAFDVKVEPSMRIAATDEEAALVVGDYEVHMMGPGGQSGPAFTIHVIQSEDGVLHADWDGVPHGPDGMADFLEPLDMWLLPAGPDGWFVPAEAYDGELWETWEGSFFEFEATAGKSPSFVMRDDQDNVMARGTRKN